MVATIGGSVRDAQKNVASIAGEVVQNGFMQATIGGRIRSIQKIVASCAC